MKCFRINEGGEHFWYAAETQEAAMAEHRSTFEDEDDLGVEILEVSDAEMESSTIDTTDGDDYPDGRASLKQLFDDACKDRIDGALSLASSVY